VTDTTEVVVIGDGAHWIWNLASAHFPQAIQILDWYHASEYISYLHPGDSRLGSAWTPSPPTCAICATSAPLARRSKRPPNYPALTTLLNTIGNDLRPRVRYILG
jgi:hypothetical protein